MTKLIITLLIVGVAVGGYTFLKHDGRGSVGDPVLSESPAASATVVASSSATFTDGTYALVAASSSMQWEGKKTLIVNYTDRGTIALKEGSVVVKDGKAVSGSVVVDMTTIKTLSTGKGSGESMQETHMKSPDFFDVTKYPTTTFVFESMTLKDGQYTVAGKLTIKGITQPVSFPATVTAAGDTLTMQATTKLDRTLWDIKYASGKFFKELGDKIIDDMFTVSFTAVAKLAK